MKGVGYTNVNGSERVWDVADYVFPSQVGDGFFDCRWPNVTGPWVPTQAPNPLATRWLSICVTLESTHVSQ